MRILHRDRQGNIVIYESMWCAAQYGRHIVPLGEDRTLLSYLPGDKALEVVGVVEASRVPIYMLLEVCTPCGYTKAVRGVAALKAIHADWG